LRKQLKGANYPAPKAIMAVAVEGAQVDFDNALAIEGRYFVDLAKGQVAKNMIQAFFFDMQAVNNRERPEGIETFASKKVDFIGLHFFSPVDKMPLLEIIKGEQTSDETLYRALDVAKQIGKVPIVVNDSRGFFTSRVIGTFINEGIAMLLEGVPAPSIEQASSQAGYPAPVLQLSDELNMELMAKIRKATAEALGDEYV